MLKSKDYYVNELLNIYKKSWSEYDKSILIDQCYELGFTTKKDIQKLQSKDKNEIINMILQMDKEDLNEKDLFSLQEEYNSFVNTVHY